MEEKEIWFLVYEGRRGVQLTISTKEEAENVAKDEGNLDVYPGYVRMKNKVGIFQDILAKDLNPYEVNEIRFDTKIRSDGGRIIIMYNDLGIGKIYYET